jgi:quercetin dioxygenase-like cupin family protein
MRVVEVEKDGYTPKHNHPWAHINYMIDGEGELFIDGKINKVKAGSFAFVPPGAMHQFSNSGKSIFRFICIVPKIGHK